MSGSYWRPFAGLFRGEGALGGGGGGRGELRWVGGRGGEGGGWGEGVGRGGGGVEGGGVWGGIRWRRGCLQLVFSEITLSI